MKKGVYLWQKKEELSPRITLSWKTQRFGVVERDPNSEIRRVDVMATRKMVFRDKNLTDTKAKGSMENPSEP